MRCSIPTVPVRVLGFIAVTTLAVTGCLSDGQTGDEGTVRFSQVVNYAETEDFSAPIAAGRAVLVALQDPQVTGSLFGEDVAITDGDTRADLQLRVELTGEPGSEVGEVWPLGFAQFAVRINDPGSYRLLATADGQQIDELTVEVKPVGRVRLSRSVTVHTSDVDGQCSSSAEVAPEQVVLHRNQRVTAQIIPLDDQDRPMLGQLALVAAAGGASIDSPLIGHGQIANAFSVTDASASDGQLVLELAEAELGQTITWEIPTSADVADTGCSP